MNRVVYHGKRRSCLRRTDLMQSIDEINSKLGRDKVRLAVHFVGKSWGVLNYQKEQPGNEIMLPNLFRGFTIDLVIMFLLYSIMAKVNAATIKDALFVTIGIGSIAFLVEPYTYLKELLNHYSLSRDLVPGIYHNKVDSGDYLFYVKRSFS